jgi:hypothetical protein
LVAIERGDILRALFVSCVLPKEKKSIGDFSLNLISPKKIKWMMLVDLCGIAIGLVTRWPRSHALPEGCTDTYFPGEGHRYIIDPGGIKKVGQEVLEYQIKGTVVTGTVRRVLGKDQIQSFRLDLKTNELTYGD